MAGAEASFPFSPEAIEAGRRLFAQAATFVRGAAAAADIPATDLPEVAFAGRSNVGKSSLINALTGRKGLARASNTPGRTQEINFFDLGGRMMLADLPGYGFAQAPKEKAAGWTNLVRVYLKGRPVLRRALVLVDARHGLKPSDEDIMTMMDESAVNYQVALTKADKLKPVELAAVRAATASAIARHVAAHPVVLATSAADGIGILEARAALSELALPE
ncbi:MAG: ribosome biogenesis GTP-binding protein YihA/YsxC [Rhodospirillaceae bacterium]|nr:ribosome biogenesis GTP-binding protein YihA/YsxC [Rhodospirillaceae bacterium]